MIMVNSWDFQRHTKTGKLKEAKPPSQIGWLTSIKAITSIWAEVKCKGLRHLKPRYLNQDALENLFGQIRGGCGSGDNPASFQFVGSLKTQILNGLTNSSLSGTNCETGEHMLLTNFTEFLNVPDTATPNPNFDNLGVAPLASTSTQKEPASIDSEIFKDMAMDALLLGKSGILSVAYVSGFFVKKILNTITCP
jgi:hypothetical protein